MPYFRRPFQRVMELNDSDNVLMRANCGSFIFISTWETSARFFKYCLWNAEKGIFLAWLKSLLNADIFFKIWFSNIILGFTIKLMTFSPYYICLLYLCKILILYSLYADRKDGILTRRPFSEVSLDCRKKIIFVS